MAKRFILTNAQSLLKTTMTTSSPLDWVRVAHLFSFLRCLHPVSCVPNVVSVSDYPFFIVPTVFSNVYLEDKKNAND